MFHENLKRMNSPFRIILINSFLKTGPASSQAIYTPTQDIGKQAPAAGSDGFRMTGVAVGPASSQSTYTATQDIGKQMPAGGEAYWDASKQ